MRWKVLSDRHDNPRFNPTQRVPKLISAYARGANNGRGVYASQDREMDRDDPSNEAVSYPPPHDNTAVVVLSMVLGLGES